MSRAMERAIQETYLGLTTPGRCGNCGKKGARFRFSNDYAEPPVEFDLCPKCMETAVRCVAFFLNTRAGYEATKRRLLAMIDESGK